MTELTLQRIFSDPDLNGAAPLSLTFSPDGNRVSFLKPDAENYERLDLWAYDLTSEQTQLLVSAAELAGTERVLSDEEKARRERKRITQAGIVEYFWAPDSGAIVFPLNGNLFEYTLANVDNPLRQLTDSTTFETDIRFSPDGTHLSFVRDKNLYVINLNTGTETALTHDGGDTVSNGLAEFIAQEEMHRFEGYWWSPDSHRIAFTQVDEATVEISQRYEIDADSFGVFDQRYPFAGARNAQVRLGMISLEDQAITWVEVPRADDSYLARVNWLNDSQLAIQVQSRNHQSLSLQLWRPADDSFTTVLEETSNTWINLHDCFTPMADGKEFLWASERSGFQHLYRYASDGTLLSTITQGDWVVVQLHGIDIANNRVLFEAFADTPLEQHLYHAPLDGSEPPTRVTEPGANHAVKLSVDLQHYIDQFSSPTQPPAVVIRAVEGSCSMALQANTLNASHPFYAHIKQQGEVSFGTLDAEDGQTLHYRLIKPAGNDGPCPLIVTVYGGPGAQLVRRTWLAPWQHYMASRGYGLLQLDNRGSTNRGKAFEDPIHGQLGVAEVTDQLAGVAFASTLPWVDADRIGVFGHSYGGYMTLMLMMKAPEVFRAGISVAPVTDWHLYDTHYTERYLGDPAVNVEGYENSGVFPFIEGLQGELLVIHGMADDNVLFTNSTKLYKALQDANLQFDIMNYPGAKHGLSGRAVNLHRYGLMDRFFDTHLKGQTP